MAQQVEKLADNDERLLAQMKNEQQGLHGVWKVASGLPEGHPRDEGLFYFFGNRLAKPFYAPHQEMQWGWRRLWFFPRREIKAIFNYQGNKQLGAWIYQRTGDRLRLEFCVPPGVKSEFGRDAMELVRVRDTVSFDEIGVPLTAPYGRSASR